MKRILRDPEIPLATCPHCKGGGFMMIRTVRPRLRHRDGLAVEYACPRCKAVVAASVLPETDPSAGLSGNEGGALSA
jgi:phage FluMu protein Com